MTELERIEYDFLKKNPDLIPYGISDAHLLYPYYLSTTTRNLNEETLNAIRLARRSRSDQVMLTNMIEQSNKVLEQLLSYVAIVNHTKVLLSQKKKFEDYAKDNDVSFNEMYIIQTVLIRDQNSYSNDLSYLIFAWRIGRESLLRMTHPLT